jgi:chemotaxis protein CheX
MMTTVSPEAIGELTRAVAETVLNMSLEPLDSVGPTTARESMFAWVNITGGWDGSVIIGCSQALAQRAAGVMFDVAPADATPSDVIDAVGELANVLGGNVKGLVPGPSVLSIPTVSRGQGPGAGGREMWFECGGEPLVVILVDRT